MQSSRQRQAALDAAGQRQADEAAAARRRLIAMGETGQPTPPVEPQPCCEGRPPGHTGKHWPLGATHPAS
jgi:hypothetical protein